MSVPSKEQLKDRSRHLAKILEEKYGYKISHGHCLEVIAKLFGFKNWHSASAAAPDGKKQPDARVTVKTVGELKELLSDYEDSMEVVINTYDYVEPDWDEGHAVGPAGWITKVYSLEMEPAHNSDPELVFDLKHVSEDWSSGPVSRELDAEVKTRRKKPVQSQNEIEALIQQCKSQIGYNPGLSFTQSGNLLYLTKTFEYDENNAIYNSGDLASKYGVTFGSDKHNGLVVSDDNVPGRPSGNKEGFLDELKSNFRDESESKAYRLFEECGFSNQNSEWDGEFLKITAQMKISDPNAEKHLQKLLEIDGQQSYERSEELEAEVRRGK